MLKNIIGIGLLALLSSCSMLHQFPINSLNKNDAKQKSFYNFDDTPKYTQSKYNPGDFKLPKPEFFNCYDF